MMFYDAQQSSTSPFLQDASSTGSKRSSDPFISQILTYLGLADPPPLKHASLPLLLSQSHHSDWQMRAAVAHRLGKLGEKAALDPLEAILLHDTHSAVRAAAARALGDLADDATVELLLAALDDPVDDVKAAAAWALGQLGEHIPTPAPLENLLNCKNATVRVTALHALGEMGARTPLHLFAAALEDADWQVREMATLVLARLRERIPSNVLQPQSEEQDRE